MFKLGLIRARGHSAHMWIIRISKFSIRNLKNTKRSISFPPSTPLPPIAAAAAAVDGDQHRDDGRRLLRRKIGDPGLDQLHPPPRPLQSRRGALLLVPSLPISLSD